MSCRALASHTVLPGSHQITTRWAERWRLANRQLTAQKAALRLRELAFQKPTFTAEACLPRYWIR